MNTKTKLHIASILSKIILLFRYLAKKGKNVITTRQQIKWCLELDQGIDLSIYILGCFERDVNRQCKKIIKKGNIVIDIGANIGAHALPMGVLVGETGQVFAFEPTNFAYKKLLKNIKLNPFLEKRMTTSQTMLVGPRTQIPKQIPSSWSLSTHFTKDKHPIHGGTPKSLNNASFTTLDKWSIENNIQHLDLVKLDVDGYEVDVLEGGLNTLTRFRPKILMEFAPYIFLEKNRSFNELLKILVNLRYICEDYHGKKLSLNKSLMTRIPRGGSINIMLTHFSNI